eukprot:1422880-Amphidinium_carterae.1
MYWLRLAGVDLDTRRLRGNHVVKSDASWMAYSGDALVGPLKVIKFNIAEVAAGKVSVPGYVPSGEAGCGHDSVETIVTVMFLQARLVVDMTLLRP